MRSAAPSGGSAPSGNSRGSSDPATPASRSAPTVVAYARLRVEHRDGAQWRDTANGDKPAEHRALTAHGPGQSEDRTHSAHGQRLGDGGQTGRGGTGRV